MVGEQGQEEWGGEVNQPRHETKATKRAKQCSLSVRLVKISMAESARKKSNKNKKQKYDQGKISCKGSTNTFFVSVYLKKKG